MYVTYGLGNKFDIDKLKIDLKSVVQKPKSAWWGSPIDAEYGWRTWCEYSDFIPYPYVSIEDYFSDDNKILWDLKPGTKILNIKKTSDLYELYKKGYIFKYTNDDTFFDEYRWNFNKVLEDGYSGIELFDACIGHRFTSELEIMMNAWDCESIVIIDPTKIVQVN